MAKILSSQKKSARVVLFLLAIHLVPARAGTERDRGIPIGPDPRLTPGALCRDGRSHRYPERILYCDRAVDHEDRVQIVFAYNSAGYRIDPKKHKEFKIDHLIPLCVGGSNDHENLWPQHESIYEITDPLEPAICEKMFEGRLKQKEAVELVIRGKRHLSEVRRIMHYLDTL
ncbi:MAG: hypothetical protein H7301_04370 [Cryobacterium sp.]|nr:hypothetical protein [Oligoflexia bacterium]